VHGDHVSFWFSHSLLKMFVLSYSILFSCTSPRMPRTPQLGLAVNMGGDDRTSAARLGQVSLPQILAIFGDSQWFAHRNTKENERKRERERDQENTKRTQGQEMNPTEPDEILNFSGFGWVCPGCHPADPAACVKQEKWCQYQGHLFPQKLVMSPQWLSMCPERLSGAECIVRW